MGITRRRFVGCVAAAATIGLPRDLWRSGAIPRWVLLDLKEACGLSESVSGYESALAAVGEPWIRSDAWSVTRCTGLIVPAALAIPLPAVRAIVTCLARGATVILESGAAFAGGPDFRAHRAVLRDCFQVRIEAPVQLWRARSSWRGVPYVDYTWPFPAKLRDFSRVVPLERQAGEIVAWVDDLPVALVRRSGRGTLVFLGSPVGPALWAGDGDARRWLCAVLGSGGQSPKFASRTSWMSGSRASSSSTPFTSG